MHGDGEFNITVFLGCAIGAAVGYHAGSISAAVLGCYVGFFASALSAALIAELLYLLDEVSPAGARVLRPMLPVLSLPVLIGLASRFWV
jgi:hypothetical protein